MEKYYNISYAIVSLIFLSNAAGFIFAAFVSQPLYSKIGRSQTILVGISLLGIASLTIAFAPPWGVIVFSYFLTGAGMALVWTFFYIIRYFGAEVHAVTTGVQELTCFSRQHTRFLLNAMYSVQVLQTAPRYLVMFMVC